MKKTRDKPIPESKIKRVKYLKDLLTNKKTILIASIKNLPSSQLQEISKSLRGKALITVPKKNLLFRAIDDTKDEGLQKLKEHFKASVAVLFSDQESFNLAAEVLKNKTPTKAKTGQEAPEDILIQAGPTDLPPGPAISELGAVGLQVKIEDGKIAIREDKVIVKKGQKISQNAADVMSKLDIKPFSIGLIPLSAFDNETKTLYDKIEVDTGEAVEALKYAFGRAMPFAVSIGYATDETIKLLLGKAGAHEKALAALVESKEGKPAEEPKVEEKPAEEEAPSEEAKEDVKDGEKEGKPAEAEAKDSETEPKEKTETQTPENKSEEPKEKVETAPAETPAESTEAPAESKGEEK